MNKLLFLLMLWFPAIVFAQADTTQGHISHLLSLNEKDLYVRDNIAYIGKYTDQSNGKAFRLFYDHPKKIDSTMAKPGYANAFTDHIIEKEAVEPALGERPDWDKLSARIARQYNRATAERIILNARLKWYEKNKDYDNLIDAYIQKAGKYGLDTAGFGKFFVNNFLYDIVFEHSTKPAALNKSIGWMELLLRAEPDNATYIDTYANLLYKAGRVDEGIKWEQKAAQLDPKDVVVRECLEKMNKHLPTWDNK